MTDAALQHPSVQHVAACLDAANHPHSVIALADTARSAGEAALALGVPVGAIVKTLVFMRASGNQPVVALLAGDRQCDLAVLAKILGDEAECTRPRADIVKATTGYAIGGVSPIGLPPEITVIMDQSLFRFDVVWAAAGHPHCVFQSTTGDLQKLTGAMVADGLSVTPNS